jgi:hypothetical protein
MKDLIGTDGKVHAIRFKKTINSNPSKLHTEAKILINKLFPLNVLVEEFPIPGGKKLFLDFLLPERNLAIEVHGEQHYKFNPHFYKSKYDFIKAKHRDNLKIDFCETNKIVLVELPFNKISDWEQIIYDKCYS